MAKYSNTKAKINERITTNSAQAITGNILNEVLQTMVDSLGADYQFGGLVQPGSAFTAGEQPVVFLATTPGTYTNFGGLVVADGEVALLVWSGTAWSKQTPDIATRTEVSQLGQEISQLQIDLNGNFTKKENIVSGDWSYLRKAVIFNSKKDAEYEIEISLDSAITNTIYITVQREVNPMVLISTSIPAGETTKKVSFTAAIDSPIYICYAVSDADYSNNGITFTIKSDKSIVSIVSNNTDAISALSEEVDSIGEDVEKMNNHFKHFVELDPASTQTGFIQPNGNIYEMSGYETGFYNVSDGDVIKIIAKNNDTENVITYAIYNSSSPSATSCILKGETFSSVELTKILTITSGAVILAVCHNTTPIYYSNTYREEFTDSTPKLASFRYSLSENTIRVVRHYGNNVDLCVEIAPQANSVNQLVSFNKFDFLSNSEDVIASPMATPQESISVTSDWIGPYQVNPTNNRDGDKSTTEGEFTGGFHGYNGDGTGSATARTISASFFANGKKITSVEDGFADEIRVCVTNLIQGSTTKKADGSGREILQEDVTYTFRNEQIYIKIFITALEPLTIKGYYGLQQAYSANDFVFLTNTINSKYVLSASQTYKMMTEKVNEMVCKRSDGKVVAVRLKDEGLGKQNLYNLLNGDGYFCSLSSYNEGVSAKSYFWLVRNDADVLPTLDTDESLYLLGSYCFSN